VKAETAYAKINLALHVRRKRPDGYHDIETVFAFCEDGDELTIEQADTDQLRIDGPFADGLASTDNLVVAALVSMRRLGPVPPLSIRLTKNLPVAAGIGGGSADAAAMIRLLDRHFVHNGDGKELVFANAHLGADVGACIVSRTRRGSGIGTDLAMAADDPAGTPVLLANPRVPLSTAAVFKAWDSEDRGPLADWRHGRNDLEAPARKIVPQIGDVLDWLAAQPGATFVRMSGSGATCFALFDAMTSRDAAAARVPAEWWHMASVLR
jgi:4-diphosphocytidyl-2-C-methyl-D-erythritol kinase